jgi:hypothetical protein
LWAPVENPWTVFRADPEPTVPVCWCALQAAFTLRRAWTTFS